mmetsp:Transcript_5320/g.13055  ORF Transcript_5320/g.13055 Transcript_5320/m.13055 type:complete len:164 (-) Transcript_5320:662-1153(-)
MKRMLKAWLATQNVLCTACRFPMVDVAALLAFFRRWMQQSALGANREGPVSLVPKAAPTALYVRMASTGHPLILLLLHASLASLAPTAPRMLHFIHSSSSMVSGVFPILPLNCCVARVAALMRFALVEVKLECARQRSQVRFAQSVQVQISTSWMESVWIVQM